MEKIEEFEIEDILEETLKDMAIHDKKFFSPHYVCAYSGIADLKLVSEYLLNEAAKIKRKKIYVYYEVECPEGDSDFSVANPIELPTSECICHQCGVSYTPDPQKVWVGFNFTPKYIEYVKKKEKALRLMCQ